MVKYEPDSPPTTLKDFENWNFPVVRNFKVLVVPPKRSSILVVPSPLSICSNDSVFTSRVGFQVDTADADSGSVPRKRSATSVRLVILASLRTNRGTTAVCILGIGMRNKSSYYTRFEESALLYGLDKYREYYEITYSVSLLISGVFLLAD